MGVQVLEIIILSIAIRWSPEKPLLGHDMENLSLSRALK